MNIPWKIKSAIFAVIDLFSLASLLYFLQRNVTKRSRLDELSVSEIWIKHASSLEKYNVTNIVFEFGAGKNLAQNLFLSSFVSNQIVVDLNPMVELDLVETARNLLSTQCKLKVEKEIKTFEHLAEYGIEYRAPFDASDTDFQNSSIDACVSTNTLEHIPKEDIIKIFNELYRVLKPEGIVSAFIDYSDHYAHTDSSISHLNYLTFSDSQWKKYNHRVHFQNRMRHYDYLYIFDDCGFNIIEEEVIYREDNFPEKIDNKFVNKPKTVAATAAYVVLKKK
jgi:SAM-dependent methyltransferase